MTTENRNLILAVLLSAIVLFGWTFISERVFPAAKPPAVAQQGAASAPAAPAASGSVPMVAPGGVRPLDSVVAASPRIAIDTPRLKGSINLVGARIDDLVLTDHTVSLDRTSAPIRLFAPSGAKDAYFAGFGWVGPGAPPADARWTASAQILSPGRPVTLRWVSPEKLAFEQVVSVDSNFVFTVQQRVLNGSASPIALRAFGYVNRTGRGPEKKMPSTCMSARSPCLMER